MEKISTTPIPTESLILFASNNMREYFWHVIISLGLFLIVIFGAITLSLHFSNNITYTDSATVTTPSVTIVDPQLGNENAPVTVVTYGDYACASCGTVETILTDFLKSHPSDIKIVWKDMPNETRHSEAMTSAIAARCAGKQGKFWEYNVELFAHQSTLGQDLYLTLASGLNLDTSAFSTCVENESTRPLVERTLSEGLALNIAATPTIFINNERFTGSLSQSEIIKALTAAMAK